MLRRDVAVRDVLAWEVLNIGWRVRLSARSLFFLRQVQLIYLLLFAVFRSHVMHVVKPHFAEFCLCVLWSQYVVGKLVVPDFAVVFLLPFAVEKFLVT